MALASSTTGSFEQSLTVLGLLLVLGALVAGFARRSFLSLTAVFVVAGFVLGEPTLTNTADINV